MEETDISDSSEADDIGEKLFLLVEGMDPLQAKDITGDVIL